LFFLSPFLHRDRFVFLGRDGSGKMIGSGSTEETTVSDDIMMGLKFNNACFCVIDCLCFFSQIPCLFFLSPFLHLVLVVFIV
jgi:hypothetical protein